MEGGPPFRRCLVGGTFDRLHAGHLSLLQAGLEAADHLEVHITSDHMASSKGGRLQPHEDRRHAVLEALAVFRPDGWSTHVLEDELGPAPTHPVADALLVSPETQKGGERINEARREHGLDGLHLIQVPHVTCEDGGVLSSSRIRAGEVDTEGRRWIDARWSEQDLVMSDEAGRRLKAPAGEPFDGPEDHPEVAMREALDHLQPHERPLVAVGDVTVRTMLEMEVLPDMALIDGFTKRQSLDDRDTVDQTAFPVVFHAASPAGRLTPDLLATLRAAVHCDEPCVVNVEGEEDLAPLFVHLLAPLGAVVLFGMPGRGLMVQRCTLKMKERCRTILEGFEVGR